MDLKAPRGTFDILPDSAKRREYVESAAMRVFESFGYKRIITPAFERTELFQRGIGEATEIVQKEMYTFTDKAGRSLTLRPEGTAPVVRAFIEHNMNGWSMPVKLSYSGQMFRYERPQAGRYREFWQLGVEAMGSNDPALDAEIIVLLMYYLRSIGLRDLRLLINSMGCNTCRVSYVSALKAYLTDIEASLCEDCQQRSTANPLRVFDCKQPSCIEAIRTAPQIDAYLCAECQKDFNDLRGFLDAVGLEYTVTPSLVRGFDYYTKTTFEVQTDKLGAQNALGGGGRYDNLVKTYGGPDIPGIGFAIGTDRVLLAMEAEQVSTPVYRKPSIFIVTASPQARETAFQLIFDLRKQSIESEMDFMGRSLKGQMKQAHKIDAEIAVIIGEEELAQASAQLKNMRSGEQKLVKLSRLVDTIKKDLDAK